MQVSIRLMQQADLPAVIALQDSCYSDVLYEPPALLAARLASAAQSCWLAENTAGELLAYLFSYPSRLGKITFLATAFDVAKMPELLYLHDMAVSEKARGLGLARALLAKAEQFSHSLSLHQLGLVAVQGSVSYWQKQGFIVQTELSADAKAALSSYTGERAQYMLKRW